MIKMQLVRGISKYIIVEHIIWGISLIIKAHE